MLLTNCAIGDSSPPDRRPADRAAGALELSTSGMGGGGEWAALGSCDRAVPEGGGVRGGGEGGEAESFTLHRNEKVVSIINQRVLYGHARRNLHEIPPEFNAEASHHRDVHRELHMTRP